MRSFIIHSPQLHHTVQLASNSNRQQHEWKELDTKEPSADDIITWIFEQGNLAPSAKLKGRKNYTILADHLGTPVKGYDQEGSLIWQRELDSYGNAKMLQGEEGFCNYLYKGQTLDSETGLAYNRFRYYDPEQGNYISQDPIGLAGGNPTLYGYVKDTNVWVDQFGLSTVYLRNNEVYVGKAKVDAKGRYGNSSTATDIISDIPNTDIAQGVEQITYERLQEGPYKDKITNAQRPVDMDNKNKVWRREQGEQWLKEKYGDNYMDVIDDKIDEHYQNRSCAK